MARTVIPLREREICRRLRLWREGLGLSRVKLARFLDAKVEWLSNFEYARSPIRYEVAQKLVGCLAINPVWLATGKGPMYPKKQVSLPFPEDIFVSPRDLFSAVYDERLKHPFETNPDLTEGGTRSHVGLGEDLVLIANKAATEALLKKKLHRWLREVSNEKLAIFAEKLVEYGDLLLEGLPKIDPENRAVIEKEMNFAARRRRKI